MHDEAVGLRHVDCDELDTRLHQPRDETYIASESIELGNNQSCAVFATEAERFGEGRAVVTFSALNLNDFVHQRPRSTVEVTINCRALCFQAETAISLSCSRHPEVAYKPSSCHRGSVTFLSTTDDRDVTREEVLIPPQKAGTCGRVHRLGRLWPRFAFTSPTLLESCPCTLPSRAPSTASTSTASA